MVTLKSTAEYAKNKKYLQEKAFKTSVRAKVESFINKKLEPEIKAEIRKYYKKLIDGPVKNELFTMVEVPPSYYSSRDQFLAICKEIMEPLGYKISESHDGAGIYATIAVEWKMPSV